MKSLLSKLSSPRRNTRDLSLNILVTLSLAFLFTLVNPNFINKYNLISIGQNLAPYAMLALGVLMPISMGGTDLSVGATCIGSAVVAGKLHDLGLPLGLCILVMLLFGTFIGLINGYLISKKKLQPFIATLGTMMFVRGSTAIFANTSTVLYPSGCWYNKIFSAFNGFPISFLWILLFAFIIYFIYRKTCIGRYMLSIGSNETATRISGVDVDKYIIIGYAGSGFMAGVASIFWSASFATITVATGNGMELDAIASAYIGGTAATGGLVNVFGSIIGSIMLVVIRSGLNFSLAKLNVSINSTYVTYIISGIIVVVAVLAEKAKNNTNNLKKVLTPTHQAKLRLISFSISVVLLCFLIIFGIQTNHKTQANNLIEHEKTVCIVMKGEGSDFWTSLIKGANAAGDEFGYKVICRGPEGEDASYLPQQRDIMSTLLSENPIGLGISTIADGFTDLLEEAYDRKISVFQYDSGLHQKDKAEISISSKNPLSSSIMASNYQNASVVAEKCFEAVKDDIAKTDEYIVGDIQFTTNTYAEERAKGFSETFLSLAEADPATKGKVKVLIEVKPSEANNAYKEALEFLYEKGARLIFGTNIYVINQCADAVLASNGKYDGVKFAGFDDGAKAFEWMRSNSKFPLLGVISQNPYMIGYLTVKTAVDEYEGRETEDSIIVPGEWICLENLDSFDK